MKFIYSFIITILSISITYAQNSGFEIIPLKGRKMDYLSTSRSNVPLQTRSAAVINLPFVEDFSYNTPFQTPICGWIKMYMSTMIWLLIPPQ